MEQAVKYLPRHWAKKLPIVASWTGIPLTKLTESEAERLLNGKNTAQQVISEEAVKAVSEPYAVQAGLKDPKAVGSFFSWVGVGKTELCRAAEACLVMRGHDSY